MDPGEQRVRLIWRIDNETAGQIEWDRISKTLDIKGFDDLNITADNVVTVTAPRIQMLGDLEVDGEIRHWGGKKLTFMDNDMTPYGTQTRNYWPYDRPMAPYQIGAGANYVGTREYK